MSLLTLNQKEVIFFRSDHFNFARVGAPVLYAKAEYTRWLRQNYHQPSDEYRKVLWNFEGMVNDARLLFNEERKLSNQCYFPECQEGSEFKSK